MHGPHRHARHDVAASLSLSRSLSVALCLALSSSVSMFLLCLCNHSGPSASFAQLRRLARALIKGSGLLGFWV